MHVDTRLRRLRPAHAYARTSVQTRCMGSAHCCPLEQRSLYFITASPFSSKIVRTCSNETNKFPTFNYFNFPRVPREIFKFHSPSINQLATHPTSTPQNRGTSLHELARQWNNVTGNAVSRAGSFTRQETKWAHLNGLHL